MAQHRCPKCTYVTASAKQMERHFDSTRHNREASKYTYVVTAAGFTKKVKKGSGK